MSLPEIIFSTPHVTVVYNGFGAGPVVVTFNEMGQFAGGAGFWGDHLFHRAGVSAIGFMSAWPNWYPEADMAGAIAAAVARIGGRRAVTYGFSQGGYGALKFGARLGASQAVAFSPQWSIDPHDVQTFDRRFMHVFDPALRGGARIEAADLCPRNHVVADIRFPEDGEHARRLLSLGRTELVRSPFSGHDTIRLISESRSGDAVVALLARPDGFANAELRRLLRACRAGSPTYLLGRVNRLRGAGKRYQPKLAAAVAALPDRPVRVLEQTLGALGATDLAEAARLLSGVSDQDLCSVDFHRYWPDFRRAAFVEGERRIGPLYRRRYAADGYARLHGVNSMVQAGLNDAAVAELIEVAGMPGMAAHAATIADLFQQAGRGELAAEHLRALCADEARPRRERIAAGLALARALQVGERAEIFRAVRLVDAICGPEDEEALFHVADLYAAIGEHSFAVHVLSRVKRTSARRELVALYEAVALAKRDPAAAQAMVARLLDQEAGDFEYWLRLSHVGGGISGARAALAAARRAMAAAGADRFRGGLRLAEILDELGDRAGADAAFAAVLALRPSLNDHGHGLALVAARLKDWGLAAQIAEEWLAARPEDVERGLTHLEYLARSADRVKAKRNVERFVRRVEDGLALSLDDSVRLFNLAATLDAALARRAAAAAAGRFPACPVFHEKQFDTRPAARPAQQDGPAGGFVTRMLGRTRRSS